MPLVQTRGAASAQGFGEFAQVTAVNYIEDMFSCFLYTGTGSSQTITNNIDLSTKGGLTWIKGRSGATNHALYDTARGATSDIASNLTTAPTTQATGLTAFGTTGFSIGALAKLNTNAATYVSWTFRKQPKFFDVVTFTKSTANLSVAHSLGSVPGCVIIKATNINGEWYVYHRGLTSTNYNLNLNRDTAQSDNGMSWISLTSTTVDLNTGLIPADGNTYVMYLFAHDAGGFGLSGTDNVISCGSYTGTGATGNFVNLGYEPQWVMTKRTNGQGNWNMEDIMRGMPVSGASQELLANSSFQEQAVTAINVTSTGFQLTSASGDYNGASNTYIYIAIRRGPMKVPTLGTSVFAPALGNGSAPAFTTGFPVDMSIYAINSGGNKEIASRLLSGTGAYVNTIDPEFSRATSTFNFMNAWNNSSFGSNVVAWNFKRAPSAFDELCYKGTGSATTINHNLTVVPELIILQNRGAGGNWAVYVRALNTNNWVLNLEEDTARFNYALFSSAPTSTTMTFTGAQVNTSSNNYVAYLFATCPNVSKVGGYTGNGSTQAIACGFTGGARFVLIKRTDAAGYWYVYDTARGMSVYTNPYIILNLTNSQTNTLGSVTNTAGGFTLNAAVFADININAASYIFVAMA